jgi:hypothetical protein
MVTSNLENSYTVPFGAYSITYFTLPDGRVCWELEKHGRVIRSTPATALFSAILINKVSIQEHSFVSDDNTDVLRQCACCGELYDWTPESPDRCDFCIAAEMEESLCQTCGGTGEITEERYTYAGIDWEAGITKPCPDCENGYLVREANGREDWNDLMHYHGKKVL